MRSNKKIHIISIGGSVMHDLAINLKKNGNYITGSDDKIYEPSKSNLLKNNLYPSKMGYHKDNITKDLDFVITGMHTKIDNVELNSAKEKNMLANIALRVNPDVKAGGHPKISTGKKTDKFGIAMSKSIKAYNFAKEATDIISPNNFEALRNIESKRLLDVSKAMGYPFHPIIDGNLIEKQILNIYSRGNLNKVDLIIGSNKNEEYLYIDKELSLEDLIKKIKERNPDKADKITSLLDLSDIPLASDRVGTNQLTACPSSFIARQMTKSGNKVYQYLFSKQRIKSENILSYHGAEIPYVFGTHDAYLPTTNNDLKLTDSMMNYWTQFAKKGNPNSDNTDVYWDEFGDDENYIIFDTTIKTDQQMERVFCDLIFTN